MPEVHGTPTSQPLSTRRMPDLVIDCGKPVGASLTFDQATLLVEVLYPTKGGFDVTVKLRPNANC